MALGALLGASWGRLGAWIAVLGGLGAVLGRLKINAEIDEKIDASWDRFYEGFSWILETKMEANWHKNRSNTYLKLASEPSGTGNPITLSLKLGVQDH